MPYDKVIQPCHTYKGNSTGENNNNCINCDHIGKEEPILENITISSLPGVPDIEEIPLVKGKKRGKLVSYKFAKSSQIKYARERPRLDNQYHVEVAVVSKVNFTEKFSKTDVLICYQIV